MPTNAENFKEVRIAIPNEVWDKLDEMREDSPVRTFQSMLAPLICAYGRGEIVMQFVQQGKS